MPIVRSRSPRRPLLMPTLEQVTHCGYFSLPQQQLRRTGRRLAQRDRVRPHSDQRRVSNGSRRIPEAPGSKLRFAGDRPLKLNRQLTIRELEAGRSSPIEASTTPLQPEW